MCPRFDSWTQRNMWVEFVVGSLLCSELFFFGYSGFPLSPKTNISKFQFHLGMYRHFVMSSCDLLGAPWINKLHYILCIHFYIYIFYPQIRISFSQRVFSKFLSCSPFYMPVPPVFLTVTIQMKASKLCIYAMNNFFLAFCTVPNRFLFLMNRLPRFSSKCSKCVSNSKCLNK